MVADADTVITVLVSAVSNFAFVPTCLLMWKQKRPFEFFLGWFTMLTSLMYHLCDSIKHRLWMNAGQWHRL